MTVEIAQLWQHNRGNYTTPTIYQKKKQYITRGQVEYPTLPPIFSQSKPGKLKKKNEKKKLFLPILPI